jgi:hypothetical protein
MITKEALVRTSRGTTAVDYTLYKHSMCEALTRNRTESSLVFGPLRSKDDACQRPQALRLDATCWSIWAAAPPYCYSSVSHRSPVSVEFDQPFTSKTAHRSTSLVWRHAGIECRR